MQDQWLMETGVVQAMMQFARGSFQVGWEQSEAPRHPIQNYKAGKRELSTVQITAARQSVCRRMSAAGKTNRSVVAHCC